MGTSLKLRISPSVDIGPLPATDYSTCALHFDHDGQILGVFTIPIPLILSQNLDVTTHIKKFSPSNLLWALISVKCLLYIVSPFPDITESFKCLGKTLNFERIRPVLHDIYPQTYIIESLQHYPNKCSGLDSF